MQCREIVVCGFQKICHFQDLFLYLLVQYGSFL